MDFKKTLDFLYGQLPMYQRQGKAAYKADLTNTNELLKALGNPHEKLKTIHIAGTNGKGTSAHCIAASLQCAGYRTGLYTSPHLKSFTERIRINGTEIDQRFVIDFVNRIRAEITRIRPSFFEITVAMAFDYFSSESVDIAVIETGLGGRLDSTNVIIPEVCLITSIGLDHMDMLGDTLEKIASEKAGIIKEGVPVVINEGKEETLPVFKSVAEVKNAQLIIPDAVEGSYGTLIPAYLIRNLPGISAVIKELNRQGWKVTDQHLQDGVENVKEMTGLKGRLQVLQQKPLIIADVSHNAEGLRVLFDQVSNMCSGKLYLVFGTVQGKDLERIFNVFPDHLTIFWTQSSVPRSLSASELKKEAFAKGIEGEMIADVNQAISAAMTNMNADDLLLVTGSTFVVAEIDDL